jgi:hypothetical protein
MIQMKIFVQAHLQSPAILGGTHMAAMGKAAVGRRPVPISERTCSDERGQGQFALLADGRRKRDHFFISSFDTLFSGLALFQALL